MGVDRKLYNWRPKLSLSILDLITIIRLFWNIHNPSLSIKTE